MSKTHFIVFTLSLIISTSAVLAFTIFRLNTLNKELIVRGKQRVTKKAEHTLKDHISVIYSLIDFQSKISSITNKKLEYRLKNMVNIVETILELKVKLVKKGKITQEEAQKQAVNEIKKIKYDGGAGYIWINDTQESPQLIMHPFLSFDNEHMTSVKYTAYKKALDNQQQLFKTFVSIVKENGGEGFVQYQWPKPIVQHNLYMNKVSYVKLFPKWKWIIGTGIYLDNDFKNEVTSNDMIDEIKGDLKKIVKTMTYNENKGYFWIIDKSDRKYPKYIMHFLDSLENKELVGPLNKYKALVDEMIEVCSEERTFIQKNKVCKNAKLQEDKELEDKALKEIEEKGQGYIRPTPQGLFRQNMPKLTYVKCHEQLDWIIGTSFSYKDYKSNFLTRIEQRKSYLNKQVEDLRILLSILATTIIFVVMLAHVLINHRWDVLGRQQGLKPQT